MTRSHEDTVRVLLERHGTTYAQDAGIELRDTPAPLFQLLVLANLLSARIGAKVAALGGLRREVEDSEVCWGFAAQL